MAAFPPIPAPPPTSYLGLPESNADVAVSGSGRFRLKNGHVQISEDTGNWRTLALPDLKADDFPTLVAALDAHKATGLPLYLTPGKVYTISSTYLYDLAGARMYGGGGIGGRGGAVIRAVPSQVWNPAVPRHPNSMRAVMAFECQQCIIDGIIFDGQRQTRDCIRLEYAGSNVFRNCDFGSSLRNGIMLSRHRWQLELPYDTGIGQLTGAVTGSTSGASATVQSRKDGDDVAGTLYISMPQLQTDISTSEIPQALFTSGETLRFAGGGTARYTGGTIVPLSQNDANTFEDCWSDGHGVSYRSPDHGAVSLFPVDAPGKISYTVNLGNAYKATTIVGSGTLFSQLDLQPGDVIFIGPGVGQGVDPNNGFLGSIGDIIDDTHINAIYLSGPYTGSNLSYIIGAGSAYTEQFAGDNNLNRIMRGLYRITGGVGIRTAGLTGDNHPFFGIVVGENGNICNQASIIMPYLEGNYGAHIVVNTIAGCTILGPQYGSGGGNGNIYRGASGVALEVGVTDLNRSAGGLGNPSNIPTTVGYDNFTFDARWSDTYVPHGITTTNTAITCIRSLVLLSFASDMTLNGTPNIQAGTQNGQRLRFVVNGTHSGIIKDFQAQAGSGVTLGATGDSGHSQLLLKPGNTAEFVWIGTTWVLVSTTGVLS